VIIRRMGPLLPLYLTPADSSTPHPTQGHPRAHRCATYNLNCKDIFVYLLHLRNATTTRQSKGALLLLLLLLLLGTISNQARAEDMWTSVLEVNIYAA
jgi:hypothetical protein